MIRGARRAASPAIWILLAAMALAARAADEPTDNPDPAELKRRLQEAEKKLHELRTQVDAEQGELDAARRALGAYQQSSEAELAKAQAKGTAADPGQPAPVGQAPSQPSAPAATA